MTIFYDFEWGDYDREFEFTPSEDELLDAITYIALELEGKTAKKQDLEFLNMKQLIIEQDLTQDNEFLDSIQEELREYFEEDAHESFNDQMADAAEYDSWFGTKHDITGC